MKNLYESLLDDGLFKDIDNEIITKWLEDHCRTTVYKTKALKDGSLKISGDLIIKNVDIIPTLQIADFKGNLHIDNCGIKSLANLFVSKYASFKGDISISNCDNLEDISDLPLNVDGSISIIGCKSLRSLEGVECLSTNVSIMKCGKRFSKPAVQKHFKIARNIYCSEEEVQANICESFSDPILIRLWDQMKNLKLKFNLQHMASSYVELDKITPSDRKTYKTSSKSDEKDMLRNVRSFLNNKGYGFVVTETVDGTFKYIYDSKNYRYIVYKNPQYRDYTAMTVNNIVQELSFDSSTMADIEFVHVYHLRPDNTVVNKRRERREAREGMINRDPKSLKEMLKQQRERYDKAIRQIRALRETDKYKVWLDKVEKIMARFSAFINKYIRESQWAYSIRYQADDVFASIRQGYRTGEPYQRYGVIYAFQKWSYNVVKVAAGDGDQWTNTSTEELEKALKWADEAFRCVGM